MGKNTTRIKIESAYGVPGQMAWAYNAINSSTGAIVLEGEVEQKGETKYHMLLRPNEGGREELGDIEENDPWVVDSKLLEILKSRASDLLGSKE